MCWVHNHRIIISPLIINQNYLQIIQDYQKVSIIKLNNKDLIKYYYFLIKLLEIIYELKKLIHKYIKLNIN